MLYPATVNSPYFQCFNVTSSCRPVLLAMWCREICRAHCEATPVAPLVTAWQGPAILIFSDLLKLGLLCTRIACAGSTTKVDVIQNRHCSDDVDCWHPTWVSSWLGRRGEILVDLLSELHSTRVWRKFHQLLLSHNNREEVCITAVIISSQKIQPTQFGVCIKGSVKIFAHLLHSLLKDKRAGVCCDLSSRQSSS